MPTPPRSGESQANFLQRCVPEVLKDKTTSDQKQAVAICYSMFRKAHDKSKANADSPGVYYQPAAGLRPVSNPWTPPSAAHQPMRFPPNG